MPNFTFSRTTARIAAWNLSGFRPIPSARLEEQVKGLALLDAEVVALVEINPITAIDTLRDGLNALGAKYESAVLPQHSNLNIGVLFKEGVVAGEPALVDDTDLGDNRKRKAFAIEMKVGKFDFMLLAVHLKSGRGKPNQKIRDEQAKEVAAFIRQRLEQRREDILLVGDFNMIPGQDVSNFHHLGGDDVLDFLSSWDLQERYSHILEKGRANLLDGFAIQRTFSKEYIRGSLDLFQMHWSMDLGREAFRETVSDHLPFVASFRIDRDRD